MAALTVLVFGGQTLVVSSLPGDWGRWSPRGTRHWRSLPFANIACVLLSFSHISISWCQISSLELPVTIDSSSLITLTLTSNAWGDAWSNAWSLWSLISTPVTFTSNVCISPWSPSFCIDFLIFLVSSWSFPKKFSYASGIFRLDSLGSAYLWIITVS